MAKRGRETGAACSPGMQGKSIVFSLLHPQSRLRNAQIVHQNALLLALTHLSVSPLAKPEIGSHISETGRQ
jgi:hypothetical protein